MAIFWEGKRDHENCMDLLSVRVAVLRLSNHRGPITQKCYELTSVQRTCPMTQSVMYGFYSCVPEGSAD